MPFGDGTGPDGRGPVTGRGLGPCGDGTPRYAGWGRGRGRFGGRGRGFFGWWRGNAAPPAAAPQDEAGLLEAQARNLQGALDRINARLKELGKK